MFSALCWGCADYLINRATARVASLPAVLGVRVVGLVALLPALAVARPAHFRAQDNAPLGACFRVVTLALR